MDNYTIFYNAIEDMLYKLAGLDDIIYDRYFKHKNGDLTSYKSSLKDEYYHMIIQFAKETIGTDAAEILSDIYKEQLYDEI